MTPDVVVDIGNSRMKWGRCLPTVATGGTVSLPLGDPKAWDEQADAWGIGTDSRWAVASVNPPATSSFESWRRAKGGAAVHIEKPGRLPLRFAVDDPDALGIDRALNALTALHRVPAGTPAVVISVGTAMTIDCVSGDGVFLGGAILPGPWLMARVLNQNTAKLPLIEPEPELMTAYRGTNTTDAIRVGIQLAIVGAAEEAVFGFTSECGSPPTVFITGGGRHYFGSWEFVADVRRVISDPTLTLEGIRIAAEALP